MKLSKKLKMNGLILPALLLCFACSKSNSGPTTVTKTTTTKDSIYKDPAQYGTPYAGVPATKDIVMYEVNTQTYTPATFQGVQVRLDSIKALGVNVIWLMPTYPVGVLKSINSPYCIKDYNGVNSNFGTLADLRNLVAAAHGLGMAVILDWVANDTSWDNVWISNKSWYQQDANGNIIYPPGTNYTDVAALNFNSTAMRTAMIRAMKYWVFTANIDGYRCDFADNIPSDFWVQALDTLNTIKTHKLIYLAEGTTSAEISAGFQMDYAFSYYSTLKGVFANTQAPSALFTTNTAEINSIPSTGTKLRYITNHDDASSDGSTITEYNGKQGALAAFVLAAYMNGVPLIYDSQEVGYPNPISIFTNVPVDYTANPDMVTAYKQILAFRTAHEAVKTGALTQYNDANIIAFEKTSGTDDVLILVNAKNSAQTFNIPAGLQNTTWTNGLTNASVTLSTQYSFAAYGYLVLKK
ncbi:Alpha amylase, catalytic domain [Mucilaginibacter mallensis]|uniref:Alpha amylase, catalytic domain n=1 Tax=Mucilaginibacter mallensis TaxID=652787 RepID=A0A1H1TK34_MUCMA|nr:alpha-amylase family glycosyl hydrolase [Mucilaginibacter mallensis]SDS59869.1 Alpha amylase, catalytic domain [Mucilaginibacter mallensis]